MNLPKSLGKATAVGALAINALACDPGRCDITQNSKDSHALYNANDVRNSCNSTHNQVIDCFVVSDDGDDIDHMSATCGPDLNPTLDSTFNACIEDKGNTCVCYDGAGAEAKCTD